MAWFLYFMGSLYLILGVIIVLYTHAASEVLNGLMDDMAGGKLRAFGLVPFSIGVLLTISAWWSDAFWGILLLGLIVTSKGIFLLFAPPDRVERVTEYWRGRMTEVSYRFVGLGAVILGIFVLSAA